MAKTELEDEWTEAAFRAHFKRIMKITREAHGLTTAQMAHRLGQGWSKAIYEKIENPNENRGIKIGQAVRFCREFGIDLEYFQTGVASEASAEAMKKAPQYLFPPAVVRSRRKA